MIEAHAAHSLSLTQPCVLLHAHLCTKAGCRLIMQGCAQNFDNAGGRLENVRKIDQIGRHRRRPRTSGFSAAIIYVSVSHSLTDAAFVCATVKVTLTFYALREKRTCVSGICALSLC